MDRSILASAIERPEIIRKIVHDYDGRYSLGITLLPGSVNEFAFLLRVEDEPPLNFPREVVIKGNKVPVIIKGGLRRPHALNRRRSS